jgi:hypothetical protein
MALSNRNLEPGTVLATRYKKETYRCEVVAGEDGKVVYRLQDGREFSSPSAAGSAVMDGTACNGWRFWSLEGELAPAKEPEAKEAPATAKAKAAPKPKGGAKARGGSKAKAAPKPKRARKPKAGENGAGPVGCGECGAQFPNATEAADHMRKEHGAPEAQAGDKS